jgi:hypothetical protein
MGSAPAIWYSFPLMSTPAEIESAIEKLPTEQLLEVAAWWDDYRAMIHSSEELFLMLDRMEARNFLRT